MSKFLPTSGSKWTDLKECDLNKYTCNSLKGCALEVDVEYSKELRELHISSGNVKKLVPNVFEKKCMRLSYENLQFI